MITGYEYKSNMKNEPQKVSDHIQKLRKSLGLPDQLTDTEVSENTEQQEYERAYWNKVKSEPEIKICSEADLYARLGKEGYSIDNDNRQIVESIVGYFAGRADCGLDLNKGIALLGTVGVGKTWLMRLMMHNSYNPFCMVNCFHIANQCEQDGSEGIAEYFNDKKTASKHLYYGNSTIGVCFNELGRERTPVKYFGNPTNVIQEILFNRYEAQIPFKRTHLTTNKTPDEIEARYGDFIRDRMREMFNVVTFNPQCQSRRK